MLSSYNGSFDDYYVFYQIGSEDMGHPRKTESVDTQENAAKFSDGKGNC